MRCFIFPMLKHRRSRRRQSIAASGTVPRDVESALAGRTQTVRMAAQRDGSQAKQKLAEAVDAAVERHGAEWERNLVSSWSTLSSAELAQVCTALSERDQSVFMRFAQRLGPEVKLVPGAPVPADLGLPGRRVPGPLTAAIFAVDGEELRIGIFV